jgi:DNA-binding MarR family transcriptional regulator
MGGMTQQSNTLDVGSQPSLTTEDIARLVGVRRWQVLAAIRRGFLPEPRRIGCYRVWTSADVDRVGKALEAAGYLRDASKTHGVDVRA